MRKSLETSSNRTQKQLGNPTSIEAASLELAAIVSVGAISSLGGRAIDSDLAVSEGTVGLRAAGERNFNRSRGGREEKAAISPGVVITTVFGFEGISAAEIFFNLRRSHRKEEETRRLRDTDSHYFLQACFG